MYNFADYASTIDYYAIIDGVVLVAALAVLIMLFAYRRNIRILIVVLSVAVLEVLVMVLSSLSDHEVLTVSRYILHYAMLALIVMCCVVYQSDLKAIFQRISNPRGLPMFNDGMNSDDELRETTAEILSACQDMAKQDVGAIIIIDSNNSINDTVLGSGTMLNAELSAALLESIFNTKAPLHDGAVIVRGNKVVAAGCFLRIALGQQGQQDTGQHISASSGGHARIAGRIEVTVSFRCNDGSPCSFQYDVALQVGRQFLGLAQAFVAVAAPAYQAFQLLDVWGQDGLFRDAVQEVPVYAEVVQGIGVQYRRYIAAVQLFDGGLGGDFLLSQSRTDGYGLVVVQVGRFGKEPFVQVVFHRGLRNQGLNQVVVADRCVDGQASDTGAHAGLGCHDCGSTHAV